MPRSTQKALGPLEIKQQTKLEIQGKLGLPPESRRLLLAVTLPLEDAQSTELFTTMLPGLLTLPLQLAVLGKGSANIGSLVLAAAKQYPHMIAVAPGTLLAPLRVGADAALFLGTAPQEELTACLNVGTLPIALPSPCITNYDPIQERGTAFTFAKPTPWHAFAAIVRALETFVFPYDWKTIQKQCLRSTEDDDEHTQENA